jgi:uncharacterized protein
MGQVGDANEGAGGGLPLGAIGAGVAVLAVVAVIVGVGLTSTGVVGGSEDTVEHDPSGKPRALPSDPARVAEELQAFWSSTFADQDRPYEDAKVAPFAEAGSGPCKRQIRSEVAFYCPANLTLYLDRGFLRDVRGANGDLAQAYVISHLYGHHVQQVLGIWDKVVKNQLAKPARTALYTRQLELEADCLAGFGLGALTGRDVPSADEFRKAATAVADTAESRVKSTPGVLNQETWKGKSVEEQREWFSRGLALADVAACDTFSGAVTE